MIARIGNLSPKAGGQDAFDKAFFREKVLFSQELKWHVDEVALKFTLGVRKFPNMQSESAYVITRGFTEALIF
jgi:hypothetical protein